MTPEFMIFILFVVLASFVLLVVLFIGLFRSALPLVAGYSKYSPETFKQKASPASQALVANAYRDLNNPVDFHIHLLGKDETNETYIHPKFRSFFHPLAWMRYQIVMHAAGVQSFENSWAQYLARLRQLINSMPRMHYHLLAFDYQHDREGRPNRKASDFYISNHRIVTLSQSDPRFVPVISVHPLKKDALLELEHWRAKGVRFVKWLPNSMNIDPLDPRVVPFYQSLKEKKMALLTHTGHEWAVSSPHQSYGNPLLYRKALDMGVTVIMAHAATCGEGQDLDNPDFTRPVSYFQLFLRMMAEPAYESFLFADLSSVYYVNRDPSLLVTLLERKELHPRLLNASDYPLPAVNGIASLGRLVKAGLLTKEEKKALHEIYRYNPILFDFVLRRTVKHPDTGQGFDPIVFEQRDLFRPKDEE